MNLVDTETSCLADASKVDDNFAAVDVAVTALEARVTALESNPATGGNFTSVKDFGAIGDGTTDDTTAIADALAAARTKAGTVFFPAGVYLTGTITVQHRDTLIGENRYNTTIKLNTGANAAVIQGTNAYALFSAPTYSLTDGANEVVIQNLTVDGNRANNLTSGDGIAIWGYGMTIRDVTIRNCRHDGLSTAWSDGSVSMEGTFQNIVIDTVGYHGWRFNGPHDTHADSVMVIDASQEADNAFNGVQVDTSGNGRFFNLHVWHRSTSTNRCWAAFSSAGACEVVASHFEGCRTQQVRHNGVGDRFIGCMIYAPFGADNTPLVVFNGARNQHLGCNYLAGDGVSTNNKVYAIQIGDSAAAWNNQVTDGHFHGFDKKSPFNFYNSGGLNRVTGRGYAAAAGVATFTGTVLATDEVDYHQSGTVINYRKPQALAVYASNAAAASAGVPVGGQYVLSATNAVTVRV